MNRVFSFALALAFVTVAGPSFAEGTPTKDSGADADRAKTAAALTRALELVASTSFTQPAGNIGDGVPSATRMAGPGFGLDGGVGLRLDPRFAIGAYGGASFHDANQGLADARTAYSGNAGAQGSFHLFPTSTLDPWVSLGAGWRGLWVTTEQGRASAQGMDIVKAQIGVDYRVNDQVRLSPFVGATLTTFFTRSLPEEGNQFTGVDSPDPSTFFSAGLAGRFDLAGTSRRTDVASR